ncbi:MAG: T9SS type A sorting domain-containing protein, partial [Flavobacteriaceae bacterium]
HNTADVISLFSDAYTDVASNRNPGWGEVVSAETHASNEVLKTTNFIPFTISTPIDITGHTLHVDVWLPQLPSTGSGLLIKILDAANGPHEGNFIYSVANITAGQWNSIDIEITNFNQIQGTWDTTAQGRVDQVLLDIVDDTTMYVDNIYFWKPPTAGLDDNLLNSVKMHPNPAKGVVKFSTASSELLRVSVYDLLGKQVIPAQTVQSELSISSLYPGVYFVKMDQGTKSVTKKLLVN